MADIDDRLPTYESFAQAAADLSDAEIQAAIEIIISVKAKHETKAFTVDNLEQFRDEALTRLSEKNILAEIDVAPCYSGEGPTIEILGKVSGDSIHQYGFDHEAKAYEVRDAAVHKEDWRGQKRPVNKPKKKDKRGPPSGD